MAGYGGLSYRAGAIFKLAPDPGGALTILHEFDCDSNGCVPAALVQDDDGDLYGITNRGGDFDRGTIYQMELSGKFSVLHDFSCTTDGCPWPAASLMRAADGALYGTAQGGPEGGGVVFQLRNSPKGRSKDKSRD